MKTIEDIKNEVAIRHGYGSWLSILMECSIKCDYEFIQYAENQAMQAYAEMKCIEQREICTKEWLKSGKYQEHLFISNAPLATDKK